MKAWKFFFAACIGFSLIAEQCAAGDTVKEERLQLPIQVGSVAEQLETLVVRPVAGDRFPLVLIVNGSAGASPSEMHPDWLAQMAHDFAHRGWIAASVVWPGYGRSTGTFMNKAGDCAQPNVSLFLDAHGDELAAALAALRNRSDVDPSTTLGVGVSIGGASMLDLAGRKDRPLTAAVNISGGVYHYTKVGVAESNCSLYQDDLVRNFSGFGRDNPTPTLWIYAANDPYFGPDLAQRLLSGYRSEGGNVEFVGLPPFEKDGHTLYKQEASVLLNPRIDDFLRRNHLPAMSNEALAPLLSVLPAADRSSAQRYLKSATEKAAAMGDGGDGFFWFYGAQSIEDARQHALTVCQEKGVKNCRIVAENMQLAEGWRNGPSAAGQ
ncbi:hypothetical protein TSH100_00205 [Azospirillum sp. TSH100]|uniref:alpha/beta hydrolase family protein n=1 Tax=Azospirillum sp. TSH100 TaxID=652764 RepID=UPI000D61A78E|nr:hypothetical protein [Azospirillum sp. TSH100]PWC91357.1 hypothetical protein TSH100_00205 [Azospirillum sp. TSH100]